jgi:hypothetical protein
MTVVRAKLEAAETGWWWSGQQQPSCAERRRLRSALTSCCCIKLLTYSPSGSGAVRAAFEASNTNFSEALIDFGNHDVAKMDEGVLGGYPMACRQMAESGMGQSVVDSMLASSFSLPLDRPHSDEDRNRIQGACSLSQGIGTHPPWGSAAWLL